MIEDVRQVPAGADDDRPVADLAKAPAAPARTTPGRRAPRPRRRAAAARPAEEELPVGVLASDEEVIRAKRFDALDADELAALYRLMSRLTLATPLRRTRRAERRRRGETDRHAPHAARQPAHRRRPHPPRPPPAPAWCAGASCCCATSRARWSPTPAPTCSSSPAPPGAGTAARAPRRSCSPPA